MGEGLLRRILLNRSCALKFFETDRLCTVRPGPTSEYGDVLPQWPAVGTMNAVGSNQRSSVRLSAGRLPSPMRSGRPPTVLVFDVSTPEKLGVKNWPVSAKVTQSARQPPSAKSTGRGAKLR